MSEELRTTVLSLWKKQMHLEQIRTYCISKKATTEEFPFDNDTLVFKVMGKMFVILPLDRWERGEENVVLKLDPEEAITFRDAYEGILGGYQMGRSPEAKYVSVKHWNTVQVRKDVPAQLVTELIDHSYNLIIQGLTKKKKEEFKNL